MKELYSTWEIYLKRIDVYFDRNQKQKYNSSYRIARSLFEGPMSYAIQSAIKTSSSRIIFQKDDK